VLGESDLVQRGKSVAKEQSVRSDEPVVSKEIELPIESIASEPPIQSIQSDKSSTSQASKRKKVDYSDYRLVEVISTSSSDFIPATASDRMNERAKKELENKSVTQFKANATQRIEKRERLFFILPVKIQSEVKTNEEGQVVEQKTGFFTRILDLLSF
jgi:hypothetical protein